MKTQVIQLDKHDDFISIRDKMSWSKSGRILLVFPRRSRMLPRVLDLHLLLRHSLELGEQLALVTNSKLLRENAEKLGIPVFRVASIAQRRSWASPHKIEATRQRKPLSEIRRLRMETFPPEARWENLMWVRLVSFSIAILAMLILLALFLPTATVTLKPETMVQQLAIPVNASLETSAVNIAGNIPARLLSTSIQKMKTARVTGTMVAPDKPATGTVRFRNLTNSTVGIPAGTIVRTADGSSIRFATTADAVLVGPAGRAIDVPVQSVIGGVDGNLPKDTLVAMEGVLGTSLAVNNLLPTSGGTDKNMPAQTEPDRKRLYEALQADILAECGTSFQTMLGAGDLAFPDTLKVSQEISAAYFPADGQPGDTLSLTLDLQCQLQYAAAADINHLGEIALDVNLPRGFEVVPETGAFSPTGTPSTDADGITHLDMQAQRLLRVLVDYSGAVQLAQGRRPQEAARRIMEAISLDAPPQIRINPAWWPWLPVFPFRITVLTSG
jgi:hypothetical protein